MHLANWAGILRNDVFTVLVAEEERKEAHVRNEVSRFVFLSLTF